MASTQSTPIIMGSALIRLSSSKLCSKAKIELSAERCAQMLSDARAASQRKRPRRPGPCRAEQKMRLTVGNGQPRLVQLASVSAETRGLLLVTQRLAPFVTMGHAHVLFAMFWS